MRTYFSAFRFVLCALCGLVLFGAPVFSQERTVRGVEQESIHENGTTESTTGAANTNGDANAPVHHESEVRDWTHDHLLYPRVGPMKRLIELQNDPRAIQHWQEGYRKDYARRRGRERFRSEHHERPAMHRDWTFTIGGDVDVAMFPAKWGLDPNQPVTGPANTGSCLTDYLVVPVDNSTTGIPTSGGVGGGQPDIVGLNNLYSGNAVPGPAGLCNRVVVFNLSAAATASGGDTVYTGTFSPTIAVGTTVTVAGFTNGVNNGPFTVVASTSTQLTLNNAVGVAETTAATATLNDAGDNATALFSYAIIGDDGLVSTSPALSMDGTRIAFVELGGGNGAARFHVLAFRVGDGTNFNTTPDQDVFGSLTTQIGPTPANFSSTAPAAGSGAVTDLQLGANLSGNTDTSSSPYVDYTDDLAYVGTDNGLIYRIKNVFCPAWAPCPLSLTPPALVAPSIDTTWGGGAGFVTLGLNVGAPCGGVVTGVVADSVGNIFAGCADGNLYGFDPTGTPITGSPLLVGDGTSPAGGIVDPPVIDEVNGWVYTESVSAGMAVVVQASVTDLTVNSTATLLTPMHHPMHAPAFNDAYFNGPAADALLYEYSSNAVGAAPGTGVLTGNPGGEFILWGIAFTNPAPPPAKQMVMTGLTPPDDQTLTTPNQALAFGLANPGDPEISPLTEFLTAGGEDRLFASAQSNVIGANTVSFDLNDLVNNPGGAPVGQVAGFPVNTGVESSATELPSGTSGIVIDNSSGAAQANSLYFGVLQAGTVVKLTQSAFQ